MGYHGRKRHDLQAPFSAALGHWPEKPICLVRCRDLVAFLAWLAIDDLSQMNLISVRYGGLVRCSENSLSADSVGGCAFLRVLPLGLVARETMWQNGCTDDGPELDPIMCWLSGLSWPPGQVQGRWFAPLTM